MIKKTIEEPDINVKRYIQKCQKFFHSASMIVIQIMLRLFNFHLF